MIPADEQKQIKEMEEASTRLEWRMRHMQAVSRSNYLHLVSCLEAAASRFDDIADLLEKKDGYDPIGFLRSSAERYRREAKIAQSGEW